LLSKHNIKSVRAFVGSEDYDQSRLFYKLIGFQEKVISHNMTLLFLGDFSFYLQDAYVKDWVDNTMLFLEIDNEEDYRIFLHSLDLTSKFKKVRISKVVENDWGKEFFLHDPSGILWHIGSFK